MPAFPDPFYRWRPHPWHGLETGPKPPELVHAYVEITPFDVVKYEVDKTTGYLRVDRPQRSSSVPPTLYGFIPRTYCGEEVGRLSPRATRGDGDPMDICIFSERPINRAEVILVVKVVGGVKMIDSDEADDKIIAVLRDDPVWGDANDLPDLPALLVERVRHYFATYKLQPGAEPTTLIEGVYDRAHALDVVRASMADYEATFGE